MEKPNETQKKTLAVAIGNQKGGVGKTTTTVMLASMLNYHTDLKVAVVDVDPQNSAIVHRNREIERYKKAIDEGEQAIKAEPLSRWMAELKTKGKGIFKIIPIYYESLKSKSAPIVRAQFELKAKEAAAAGITLYETPDDLEKAIALGVKKAADELALATCKQILAKGEYDIVFFDFPGFIGDESEAKVNIFGLLLRIMNYVFVPVDIDNNTVASTGDYLKVLYELKRKRTPNELVDFAAFMWKFSNAKNTSDFLDFNEGLKKTGIAVMESKVFEANEFKMNFSTVRPVDLPKEKSLMPFMNEFLKFCGVVLNGKEV